MLQSQPTDPLAGIAAHIATGTGMSLKHGDEPERLAVRAAVANLIPCATAASCEPRPPPTYPLSAFALQRAGPVVQGIQHNICEPMRSDGAYVAQHAPAIEASVAGAIVRVIAERAAEPVARMQADPKRVVAVNRPSPISQARGRMRKDASLGKERASCTRRTKWRRAPKARCD